MRRFVFLGALVGISSKSLVLESAIDAFNQVMPYKLKPKQDLNVRQEATDEAVDNQINYWDFNYTQVKAIDDYGDVGFELVSDFDLSMGYTTPWSNED